MLRLRVLGGIDLDDPDGTEVRAILSQPKRLALLVHLALATPRGFHRRDRLLALFWPELDASRARNALSQALHVLRRSLGEGVLVSRGDQEIAIAPGTLWCDAIAFENAVANERAAEALQLYRGDLLDAFFFADAPAEFERWVEMERARLRRIALSAALAATAEAEAQDNLPLALHWAGRALGLAPNDERVVRRNLEILHRQGDRSGMMAVFEMFKRTLREDLEHEPSAELQEYVTTLLSADVVRPAIAAAHPTSASTGGRARPVWKRGVLLTTTALVTLAVITGVSLAARRASSSDAPRRPVLAVLPFENLGVAGDVYFADGLTDEVRARLTGISGLQVIGGVSARQYRGTTKSPREIARELGATHVLTGTVRWERTPMGGRVRVSPELVRASDQANVWAQPLEGPLDDVFAMQSRVAEQVASALHVTLLAHERRSVAARRTTNLAAYDAYLRGLASTSRTSVFSAAARKRTEAEFVRAIALDPSFANAYAQLARSYLHELSQGGDSASMAAVREQARVAIERAWTLDSTAIDVRLIRAEYFSETGLASEAERLVRETARMAPDNVEVLQALGDVEEQAGRFESATAVYRRATTLDPRATDAWSSLAGSLKTPRHYEEAISAREHEIALVPDHDVAYASQASDYLLWRGDTTSARRTLERGTVSMPWVVRLPGGIAGNAVWQHLLPPAVLRARDTLTLRGYLAGAGGIAPELYHLVKLRHHMQNGRSVAARAHADSLVAILEPALRHEGDRRWFFGWFSRRSLLAEAYATLGRNADASSQTDHYVAEARESLRTDTRTAPWQLCHALYNSAFVDAQLGRKDVVVARLSEALRLPCGQRVSRALLQIDPSWTALRGYPAFERLLAGSDASSAIP